MPIDIDGKVQVGTLQSNSNVEFPYRCVCGTKHSAWLASPVAGETAVVEHDCGVCGERSYMTFGFDGITPNIVNIIRNTSTRTAKKHNAELAVAVWAATYAQAFAYLKLKDANGSQTNERHAAVSARTADEAVSSLGCHGPKP